MIDLKNYLNVVVLKVPTMTEIIAGIINTLISMIAFIYIVMPLTGEQMVFLGIISVLGAIGHSRSSDHYTGRDIFSAFVRISPLIPLMVAINILLASPLVAVLVSIMLVSLVDAIFRSLRKDTNESA